MRCKLMIYTRQQDTIFMYIKPISRRLVRSVVLEEIGKSKVPWICQRRKIQVINKNSAEQGGQQTDLKYEKLANLKFDPSDEVTDFTSFGILPFLQAKINNFIAPQGRGLTSAPDYNVPPTHDQRSLLSVLNSGHSLIQRGASQSGNSLALATYCLNSTLSRVPNFGALRNTKSHHSIDSIIIVPTDLLIGKYEYYFQSLAKDIPEICCPDQLFNEGEEMNTYSLRRRPLTVKFLYSNNTNHTLCTSNSPDFHSDTPQILVTTSSKLYDIMNDNLSVDAIKKESLNELRFFAVDDMDFLLNTTSIGDINNTNFIKSGKKSRYTNKIEKIINDLQALQVNNYSSNLAHRLKIVEATHRNINKQLFENNKFDHAKFVLEDNSLSITNVTTNIENLFKANCASSKPNISLLKKLIKVKRKVLYKPIQYCFIFHPKHSYQQLLLQMNSKQNKREFDSSIMKELQRVNNSPNSSDNFQQEYVKYLLEKVARNDNKYEDLQISYIEKLIRLDDSKRFYRKKERQIVSTGSFNLQANKKINSDNGNFEGNTFYEEQKIKTHIVEAINDKALCNGISIRDIDICKNFPSKSGRLELLENDVRVSRYNIKNYLKSFLKSRILLKNLSNKKKNNVNRDQLSSYQTIRSSILSFRLEYPLNTLPILIVVPPFINLDELSSKLNNERLSLEKYLCLSDKEFLLKNEGERRTIDYMALKTFFLSQSPKENERRTNLIIHPNELIGQEMNGLTNMLVLGIESMLPQLALQADGLNARDITGIEDPLDDLMYFYLAKLSSSSISKVKNFLLVLDSRSVSGNKFDNLRIAADLHRLGQIIHYNDLPENVELAKLCDEKSIPNELVYGINDSFMQKLKTVTNKHVNK